MPTDSSPGKSALIYHESKVAWATADFVRRPPAAASTVAVYLLLAFFVCAAVYSTVAMVPVAVQAAGSVTTAQPEFPVVSATNAKVATLAVTENQTVSPGQLLYVTDHYIPDDAYKAITADIRSLAGIIAADRAGRCGKGCERRLEGAVAGSFQTPVKGEIQDLLVQTRDLIATYHSDRLTVRNLDRIMAEQHRQIRVSTGKLAVIRDNDAEKALSMQVEELKSRIGQARSQIAERRQSAVTAARMSQEKLLNRVNALQAQVTEFRDRQIVRSPIAGVVVNLKISGAGQQISTGMKTLDVVPVGSPLVADIMVPNHEIAKISAGMAVKLDLAALPEREYGPVLATISEISATAVQTESAGGQSGAPPAYRVRAKLARTSVLKDGKKHDLRPGMQFNASIIARRERLIVLGIKKVFKIKDEFLGT